MRSSTLKAMHPLWLNLLWNILDHALAMPEQGSVPNPVLLPTISLEYAFRLPFPELL